MFHKRKPIYTLVSGGYGKIAQGIYCGNQNKYRKGNAQRGELFRKEYFGVARVSKSELFLTCIQKAYGNFTERIQEKIQMKQYNVKDDEQISSLY